MRTNSDEYQTKQLNTGNSTHANNYGSAFCLYPSNFQPPSHSHLTSHNSKHIIPHKKLNQTIVNTKPQGLSPKITSIKSISFKNAKHFPQGCQAIQVTTRSRPKLNTFEQKTIKRKRAPNNKNNKMNNEKITIATQTEDNTNKGLGRSTIRPPKPNLPVKQYR